MSGPAVATGAVPHVIVLVDVELAHPFVPVSVSVAVNDPLPDEGVKVARAGSAFCVHVPVPPLHVGVPEYVPVAVAPVIVIAAVPVHVVMSGPAVATGAVPHVIVLVDVELAHPFVPVSVSVAVNDPLPDEGVKVARAGSAFCVHVPVPPLHVGVPEYVPVAVAPVIVIAAVPVHVVMSGPAVATGAVPHVIVLVDVELAHPFVPVSVSVAVNDPLPDEGVKVARAGSAFCVHVPVPPLHVGVPEYVPVAVAPVIVIAAVPVHVVMSGPAVATGAVPHVIVLVDVELAHPFVPVSVSVAVNDPLPDEGVKVARAGSAFCVHVPVPPLHVGVPEYVPVAVAPVIVIAAVPVHVVM